VEYLLLHAFTAQDFIVPDKQYGKKRIVEPEDDEQNVQVKHFDKRIIVLILILILILKRNSQWPRWGLSGSVCIQLCCTPPSWLQFSLHLGVSHPFSSVFFVCLLETAHISRIFHFTWYLIPAFKHSVGKEVAPHLQSVRLWS
jgi:hypothetical protein